MPIYIVEPKHNIAHKGKFYDSGKKIDLSTAEASDLLKAKKIRPESGSVASKIKPKMEE